MSENQGKGRVTLKEYFEADKMPREGHFADLIDSGLNKTDDQLFINIEGEGENSARFLGIGSTDPQSPLSIRNRTGGDKLIGLEDTGGSEEWHISINPAGLANGLLLVNNNNPDTALMMEADGKVGIGTQTPEERLHVNGSLKLEQGVAVHEISNNTTLNENSPEIIPTQQAVKEYVDNLLVGSVSAFAMETPPEGWLECNGQAVGREYYDQLFNKIGTAFGAGNGQTTFNLPDMRGVFVRGLDGGRGMDSWSSRNLGTFQQDAFQHHGHTFQGTPGLTNYDGHSHLDYSSSYQSAYTSYGWSIWGLALFAFSMGYHHFLRYDSQGRTSHEVHQHSYTPQGQVQDPSSGKWDDNETRPKNVALLYCIKF